jgi:hypothetical protein
VRSQVDASQGAGPLKAARGPHWVAGGGCTLMPPTLGGCPRRARSSPGAEREGGGPEIQAHFLLILWGAARQQEGSGGGARSGRRLFSIL